MEEPVKNLSGKRILLVEDDYLVAADLVQEMSSLGIKVVGPSPSLEAALEMVRSPLAIDGAVLDINLGGTMVYPLADELDRLCMPFVFATGYDRQTLPLRHADRPFVQKPIHSADLTTALSALIPAGRSLRTKARQNRVLSLLSERERTSLLPMLREVSFKQGAVLERQHASVGEVCFPTSFVGSVVSVSPKGHRIETALVGREGMTGFGLVAGDRESPYELVAVVEGKGLSIPSDGFLQALKELPELRSLTLRFLRSMNIQVSYTALAHGTFEVPQRLARWILMLHDRTSCDNIAITHEYLARMLGVRRPGVTTALHLLEGKSYIRSLRGKIVIRDRAALVGYASDSYGLPEAEYSRLMERPFDGAITQPPSPDSVSEIQPFRS
jgi:CRP-like cAMP-binding protein